MFSTYLRRELMNRRRQTFIVAIGMALAIALVIVVNAASAGVQAAQTTALQSIYGVGTDLTVAEAPTAPSANGPQRFAFGPGGGSGSSQSVATNRLTAGFATPTFSSTVLTEVAGTSGVQAATGVLQLRDVGFNGTLPTFDRGGGGFRSGSAQPSGGADGKGGSSFSVNSFTVLGYDPAKASTGPISSTRLTSGRELTSADSGEDVAVLDSAYATSASLKVGSVITMATAKFTVVGLLTSTATSGASAADVYIPLQTAQTVAGLKDQLTGVDVTAASADDIDGVDTALTEDLGSGYTVNTQAALANDVSGSLSTASTLANSLGLWLSIAVLVAAFLIAVLFTVSGVTRRTREFGTLKAIGWSNRRIVGQVAGESLVQGLIGAVIGVVLGLAAILVVNAIHPTLTASAARAGGGFRSGGFGGAGGGAGAGAAGGFGSAGWAARSAADIVLSLPITGEVILIAVGLAILGGLIAGAFGGWRASRLRPAEALRSVA